MDPLEGLTLSQAALVEAVNESPATEEERLIVCVPGALPPALAEEAQAGRRRLVGNSASENFANSVVACVGDVEVASRIYCYSHGRVERRRWWRALRRQKSANSISGTVVIVRPIPCGSGSSRSRRCRGSQPNLRPHPRGREALRW